MVKKVIILISIILLCLVIYGCSTPTESSNNVDPVLDVTQFFRITSEQLIDLIGEPKEVDKWNYEKADGNVYPITSYYYDILGECEFLVIDNKVARLNINNEMQFKNEKDIFRMFGIVITDNIKKVADTGYALRYSPVSDKVADLWITNINDKKFDNVKITYDLRYFN